MSEQLQLFTTEKTTTKPPKMKRCAIYECQLVRSSTVKYTEEKISNTTIACRVVSELMKPVLENSPNEKFVVISLDTKLKVIGTEIVTVGTLDSSLVHPREAFRTAIILNASSIILAHNHPSGDVTPSREDYMVTERMKRAGEILGIQVIDHIVVGHSGGEWKGISLAEYPH